jgi:hypothetical protein
MLKPDEKKKPEPSLERGTKVRKIKEPKLEEAGEKAEKKPTEMNAGKRI